MVHFYYYSMHEAVKNLAGIRSEGLPFNINNEKGLKVTESGKGVTLWRRRRVIGDVIDLKLYFIYLVCEGE